MVGSTVVVVEEIAAHDVRAGLDRAREALVLARSGFERGYGLSDAGLPVVRSLDILSVQLKPGLLKIAASEQQLHLGTPGCQAHALLDFLRVVQCENLFLVGAGTHPGAGLPGVLSSARVLDRVVPHADELV